MMMMSANPNDLPLNHHHHHNQIIMGEDHHQDQPIIINSSCPISWKLYHNPFFSTTNTTISNNISPLKLKPKQLQRKYSASAKFFHHHHSSSSSDHQKMNHKSSSSSSPPSCSSTISTSSTNCDDFAKTTTTAAATTQVAELKAELEKERKQRKKAESLNKKLSRELVDQVEKEKLCICEDLTKEISSLREQIEKMKKEMDEERKMLRMAEVLREERVQMKLADAHHLFYHHNNHHHLLNHHLKNPCFNSSEESKKITVSSTEQKGVSVSGGKSVNMQRKVSPEAENPHIKQGIKGFVEFQRAIKAKNGGNYGGNYSNYGGIKQLGKEGSSSSYNKLECQKAQLRVLFKHKYPVPYSQNDHNIIIS